MGSPVHGRAGPLAKAYGRQTGELAPLSLSPYATIGGLLDVEGEIIALFKIAVLALYELHA